MNKLLWYFYPPNWGPWIPVELMCPSVYLSIRFPPSIFDDNSLGLLNLNELKFDCFNWSLIYDCTINFIYIYIYIIFSFWKTGFKSAIKVHSRAPLLRAEHADTGHCLKSPEWQYNMSISLSVHPVVCGTFVVLCLSFWSSTGLFGLE